MASSAVRRPIPALIFIVALSLLAALVWVRVINRTESSGKSSPSPTCTTTTAAPVALPRPTQVRVVSVLNATDRAGLAASVRTQLHARGFVIGTVGDDPTPDAGVGQVRYGPKAAAAARLVQIYLPGTTLVPTASTTAYVTVSLGTAFARLATAAEAAKAVRSPSRTVRTCK